MKKIIYTAWTLLLAMLLAGSAAVAQEPGTEAVEPAAEVEEPAEGERDVTFDWFTQDSYGLTVFLPEGGTYYSPEDLGITPEDDPMNYLLIWVDQTEGQPFNMIMLGTLESSEEITEDDYIFYFDEFMRNVSVDFPTQLADVDAVDIHDRIWDRFCMADDNGTTMLTYLTFIGETYYSVSFFSGPAVTLEDAQLATTEQLDLVFLHDDFIPEDDILLPWYF